MLKRINTLIERRKNNKNSIIFNNIFYLIVLRKIITVNLSNNTEDKFNRLLGLYDGNFDELFNGMLEYKLRELEQGIRNIEMDFTYFEEKYGLSTQAFYKNFSDGKIEDHNDDYFQWSGEYEVWKEFHKELKQLS